MHLTIKSLGSVLVVQCDRIAHFEHDLEVLSIEGEQGAVRAIKWAMSRGVPMTFHGDPPFQFLVKGNHGYTVRTSGCKLSAISKRPGLVTNDAELYDYLHTRHTTPMLREWTDAIRNEMIRRKKLRVLASHGCSPLLVSASTADLDSIVTTIPLEWPHV